MERGLGGAEAPEPEPPQQSAPEPERQPPAPQAEGPGQNRRRRGRRGRGRNLPRTAEAQSERSLEARPELTGADMAAAVEPSPGAEPETRLPLSELAPEIAATAPPAPAPLRAARAPKGVVVLAIGLPGSGKSSWFKRRGVTPLSSDLLRTILFDNITEQRYQDLVFSILRSLLRARMIARMPWNYVDATNLNPKERHGWIKMARDFGYEVHAVFFDVPLEVCLERNHKRMRVVPEDIMQRMAAKLRAPSFEEGFSKIIVVRVKKQEPGSDAAEFQAEGSD